MSADPHDESVSVEKLVDDSVSLALINGYRQTTEITRDLPDDLPPIWIDPLQGEQVLFNLIRNAFQAMATDKEQSHKVLISARCEGEGAVELSVEDNGPGVDPEIRDSLFDSFVTTKSGGMGIGLAICRQIVEAYGGRLTVSGSEKLGGARFAFTFPTKPSEEMLG